MNTSFEKKKCGSTNEWYTPPEIVAALGPFDLDPCAPIRPPYKIANNTFDVMSNGLVQSWDQFGKVFLNPPYSHPVVDEFINKMIQHNNGIALLFARCDQKMWQDGIFTTASALLFIRGRVKFLNESGQSAGGAGCGSVLVSWGSECATILENCIIPGKYIKL